MSPSKEICTTYLAQRKYTHAQASLVDTLVWVEVLVEVLF